jgi:hypothetical protein
MSGCTREKNMNTPNGYKPARNLRRTEGDQRLCNFRLAISDEICQNSKNKENEPDRNQSVGNFGAPTFMSRGRAREGEEFNSLDRDESTRHFDLARSGIRSYIGAGQKLDLPADGNERIGDLSLAGYSIGV